MGWRESYLDAVLVPFGLLLPILYHGWLWGRVRSEPHRTVVGIDSRGRRLWVLAMMKEDADKKSVLAVQTMRNEIMGSTLMATTSILLCSGLAAVISSTHGIKKPPKDSLFGAHGEFMLPLKYVLLLLVFAFSFLCYSLSIKLLSHVSFLINTPPGDGAASPVTPEYVCDLLEKGFALSTVGNRLFYAALPLLLWIFGPLLVLLSSAAMVPILYHLDIVSAGEGKMGGADCMEA